MTAANAPKNIMKGVNML